VDQSLRAAVRSYRRQGVEEINDKICH